MSSALIFPDLAEQLSIKFRVNLNLEARRLAVGCKFIGSPTGSGRRRVACSGRLIIVHLDMIMWWEALKLLNLLYIPQLLRWPPRNCNYAGAKTITCTLYSAAAAMAPKKL
jgi:hypothetical protein